MSDFGRIMALDIGLPGQTPRRLLSVVDGDVGLRIMATVRRTDGAQDDTAAVKVMGLAPQTVALLQTPGVLCRVLAGYGETLSEVAAGRVLPTTLTGPRRDGGADWVTSWSISDGGLDIRDTIVSESWAGEVSALQVLDVLIRRSNLARGSIALGRNVRWASGLVVAGTLRETLRKLARATRSVIVVQGGAIQAWPVGQSRASTAVRLTSGTGLIGSPEPGDEGTWTVRADFLAASLPGDQVVVESETFSGTGRVRAVSHTLDSADGPYETELEVAA